MKCIQQIKTGKIKKVSDTDAQRLVDSKMWKFINKSVWKKEVRDVKRAKENKPKK